MISSDGDMAVRLWVDHPFESKREIPGERRYGVALTDDRHNVDTYDSYHELEAALEALFRKIRELKKNLKRGVKEWMPKDSLSHDEWDDPEAYLKELIEEYLSDPRA